MAEGDFIVNHFYKGNKVEKGHPVVEIYVKIRDSLTCNQKYEDLNAFFKDFPFVDYRQAFVMDELFGPSEQSCTGRAKVAEQMRSVANTLISITNIAKDHYPLLKLTKDIYMGVLAAVLEKNLNTGGKGKGSYVARRCVLLYDILILNQDMHDRFGLFAHGVVSADWSTVNSSSEVQECMSALRVTACEDDIKILENVPVLVSSADSRTRSFVQAILARITHRISVYRKGKALLSKERLFKIITKCLFMLVKCLRKVQKSGKSKANKKGNKDEGKVEKEDEVEQDDLSDDGFSDEFDDYDEDETADDASIAAALAAMEENRKLERLSKKEEEERDAAFVAAIAATARTKVAITASTGKCTKISDGTKGTPTVFVMTSDPSVQLTPEMIKDALAAAGAATGANTAAAGPAVTPEKSRQRKSSNNFDLFKQGVRKEVSKGVQSITDSIKKLGI